MNKYNTAEEGMRLDKWLWVARFFKTRALAQKHIELGRVQVNGTKVKNSKTIVPGDEILLVLNSLPYQITVVKLNHMRRPAAEAQQLYREDAAVAARREQQKQQDKASRISAAHPDGRPTKRDRRELDKVKHTWE